MIITSSNPFKTIGLVILVPSMSLRRQLLFFHPYLRQQVFAVKWLGVVNRLVFLLFARKVPWQWLLLDSHHLAYSVSLLLQVDDVFVLRFIWLFGLWSCTIIKAITPMLDCLTQPLHPFLILLPFLLDLLVLLFYLFQYAFILLLKLSLDNHFFNCNAR